MTDDAPNSNAMAALLGSMSEEQKALLDQANAARAPAPPRTVSTAAGAAGVKTYSLDEIAALARVINPAAGGAAMPYAPPVTSRATPPPPSADLEHTPVLQLAPADRKALLDQYIAASGYVEGNKRFAERHTRELAARNVRLRGR